MLAMKRYENLPPRVWGRNLVGVLTIAALLPAGGLSGARTATAAPAGPPPKEGRIINLDDKPFTFRLARKQGALWSDPMMLPPGATYALKVGGSGADALEGISGDGKGHVTIEYS